MLSHWSKCKKGNEIGQRKANGKMLFDVREFAVRNLEEDRVYQGARFDQSKSRSPIEEVA